MTQTYEDFSKYGKEFADTGLKSFASLSKGAGYRRRGGRVHQEKLRSR